MLKGVSSTVMARLAAETEPEVREKVSSPRGLPMADDVVAHMDLVAVADGHGERPVASTLMTAIS